MSEQTGDDHDPDVTRTAIGSGADEAAVRNDLLAAWLDDEAAGRSRVLADYQALFPGHEELVAVEYRLLTGEAELPALDGVPGIPDVELLEQIGSGGQGVVYRGRQTYLDREVAVKVLSPTAWSASFASRFQREAKTLASLRHPNIVACHQAGVTDRGQGYMVMEFVSGRNLRQWLDANGPMPEAMALRVGRDLARALEHGYESGIIHRDVKPENVLLQPIGDTGGDAHEDPGAMPFECKLADLGLARAASPLLGKGAQTQLTPVGAVMGSPRTMAPEQFDDPDGVDFRADIYGLGCVLFHALSGRPAFEASTLTAAIKEKVARKAPDLRECAPRVQPRVAALVASMIAAEPADRPSSHGAVATACEELLGEAPQPSRRNVIGWVAAIVLIALFVVFDPVGVVRAPEVLVAPSLIANAGDTVQLQASGSEGLEYSWREVTGFGVEIENAQRATASFVAPLGIEATYRFEVTGSNGWRERKLQKAVKVTGDPKLAPLATGQPVPYLRAGLADPVNQGWRKDSERGTWAEDEELPRVAAYCDSDATRRSRRLPRGAFRVRGSMAPDVIDASHRPERVGVAFCVGVDREIELVLVPEKSGYAAAIVAGQVGDAPRREVGVRVSGAFDRDTPVGFAVEWDGAVLVLRFGVGEEASWASRRLEQEALGTAFPPHTIALSVKGGRALFGALSVEALK